MSEIKGHDISGELNRTYQYTFYECGKNVEVFIEHPVTMWCGMGHAFHRVWDGDKVHLCHAPGPIRDIDGNIVGLCKISWTPKDPANPCRF